MNLRGDAEAFREVLENLENGVAIVRPDGRVLYSNDRFARLLGLTLYHDRMNWDIRTNISATSWQGLSTALSEAMKGPVEGELKLFAEDQGDRTVRLSLRRMMHEDPPAIAVVANEITEMVEANRALKDSQSALRTLSARILYLQDEERRRIARDLHDSTGQELVALTFMLNGLSAQIEKGKGASQQSIAEAVETANKISTQIRTVSYLLHPPLLDEMGLGSALAWYVEGLTKRSELDVTLEIPPKIPRFAQEKETALFRVIQAALTNVSRHSQSQRAWIRVEVRSGAIEVSIHDKGKGIEPRLLARIAEGSKATGVGISGMRERLSQLGGSLYVTSGKDGTRVTAMLPVETSEAATARSHEDATAAAGASQRKRVLIVDDHEVMRRGIRALFDDQRDLEICGEARNGIEAIKQTRDLQPDVVILDLSMPEAGGLMAAQRIREQGSPAKILAFSSHNYRGLETLIQSAGCDGFVLKSYAARDLLRGVREVLAGRTFYANQFSRSVERLTPPADGLRGNCQDLGQGPDFRE